MIPVAVRNRTDTDLNTMKFLILALCVCAASAASFGYTPYQPTRLTFNAFAKSEVKPATAPVVAAKATYQDAQVVPAVAVAAAKASSQFGAPVAAAKATYDASQFGASPSVAAAKATYDASQFGASPPVAAAKATYDASQFGAPAPVAAAKAVLETRKESDAPVLRSESEITEDGFDYKYETANGISSQASAIKKLVDGKEFLVIQGSYRYYSPDGTPIEVTFIADENGFQPKGNHLPVAPPVPEDIARSIEFLRSLPPQPENN